MVPEAGEPELELPGGPCIVGVEQGHEITPAQGDSPVAGRGHAAVRVKEVTHPRVIPIGPLDQVARVVGRAVVDDEDLGVLVSLGPDAVDRLADAVGAVERRDDHADQWFRHRVARLVASAVNESQRTVRELIRFKGPILRTLRARGLHHATLHLKKMKSTS